MEQRQESTAETCQHTVEGIYHGRTELGVGQHDKIKTRLNEELHTDYGDYLVKEESDRAMKIVTDGEPQTVYGYESSTGSAADIGYESAMSIVNKRKQLNEDRRAEYEAHLSSKGGPSFQHDGSGDATRMPTEEALDESTMTVSSYGSELEQKQHNYDEALRELIAENMKITDSIQEKQESEDGENYWARGSGKHFDSSTMKGFSGSSQSSEKEELDERSQKQHDYAEALREQIAEKKKITEEIKKKQDFEDERSDLASVGGQHFQSESRSMRGFSGSSQSLDQDEHDQRRQKQQEYAEALRQQIAEKKNITDRIKKRQDFEDDRNDRTDESRKAAPHYFNSESPKKSGYPANYEVSGQEELDERRQKQQDYADALRDQIAEKKTISDGIKKKEDEEDEKNDWAHGSSHDYHHGSYGQLNSSGGS